MQRIALGGQFGNDKYALVDDQDYAILSTFTWHLKKSRYGSTDYAHTTNYLYKYKGRNVYLPLLMHRIVAILAGWDNSLDIDHVDGDGLDNRRVMLRSATKSQNRRNVVKYKNNTSGYKGVVAYGTRWKAQIKSGPRTIYLGLFDDSVKAAQAYDIAALNLYGKFSRLNFP